MATAIAMTLDDLARFLRDRAETLRRLDLSRPLAVILQLAKASVKENFATGHAPDGNAWLPLQRPRPGKRHQGSSPLPLLDTGLLMASVTAAGPHHVEHLGSDGFAFGTNLEYAAIHQFGGTIKAHDVTIPARPFLGWSEQLIEQTAEVLGEALAEEVLG